MTVALPTINQKHVQQQSGGEGSEQIHVVWNGLLCTASPTCQREQWHLTLASMFIDHHSWQQSCSHSELFQADTGLALQPSTAEGLKPTFFIAQPSWIFTLREKVWMWHKETVECRARLGRQGELYCFSVSLSPCLTVNNNSPTRKSTKAYSKHIVIISSNVLPASRNL